MRHHSGVRLLGPGVSIKTWRAEQTVQWKQVLHLGYKVIIQAGQFVSWACIAVALVVSPALCKKLACN